MPTEALVVKSESHDFRSVKWETEVVSGLRTLIKEVSGGLHARFADAVQVDLETFELQLGYAVVSFGIGRDRWTQAVE